MDNDCCLVLLAGGRSSRMGQVKGLLPFGDKYWIEEQIDRFTDIGNTVYIGLGYDFEKYFDVIPLLKIASIKAIKMRNISVQVVVNPNPVNGPFSTLKCVLKTINHTQRIFIQPIDVPLTTSLNNMLSIENQVIVPRYKNQHGHPVLISNNIKNQLIVINEKDDSARLDFQIQKLSPELVSYVDVDDDQLIMNINKMEDWNQYISTSFAKHNLITNS